MSFSAYLFIFFPFLVLSLSHARDCENEKLRNDTSLPNYTTQPISHTMENFKSCARDGWKIVGLPCYIAFFFFSFLFFVARTPNENYTKKQSEFVKWSSLFHQRRRHVVMNRPETIACTRNSRTLEEMKKNVHKIIKLIQEMKICLWLFPT